MVLTISVRRDDTLLVDGRMTYVFVDPVRGGKIEIPARVRAMLSDG